jgi:hypothetical protein
MANPTTAKTGKSESGEDQGAAYSKPADQTAAAKPPETKTAAAAIPGKTREEIELEQELEGFVDLQPDRADGWLQPSPGAFILGRLLGRFEMQKVGKKKARAFYQVKVKRAGAPKSDKNPNGEVFMVSGKGDESTTAPVTKGMILAIDERKALEQLVPYAHAVQFDNGVFDVYILHLEKIDIAGGENQFWRMNVRTKQLKAPTSPLRIKARDASDEDGEIPF